MDEKLAEVLNALEYHPLGDNKEKAEKFENLRNAAKDMAYVISEFATDGREKALAYTHLEETLMWAIKSVAIRD